MTRLAKLIPVLWIPAAVAAEPVQVVLWQLRPLGMEPDATSRLEQMLRSELGKVPGYKLLEKASTEAHLEAFEKAGCGTELECICHYARPTGARKLVTGVIGALGRDFTVDLKLVDLDSCREERRINEALTGREDLLIGAIRAALYKLAAPGLYAGALKIEVAAKGARVSLDGRQVGITPLGGPIQGLRPGRHRLEIELPGASKFSELVPVRFQQVTVIKVDLVRSTVVGLEYKKQTERKSTAVREEKLVTRMSPRVAAAGWSSLAVAAAALVSGGICTWRMKALENQLESAAKNNQLGPYHQDTITRGRRWAFGANLSWGVAAAAAVLGGALLLGDVLFDPGNGRVEGVGLVPMVGTAAAGLSLGGEF
ncbi:MAG: PEGA domain-containing protein [Deltaproteobacteria bacterium]|nr:MAG: PEGA domain-containing protein [Deltaproteobacteria bacterium]